MSNVEPGESRVFVFLACDPLHNVSAWGHLGSSGIEWGLNRGEGVAGEAVHIE